MKMQAKITGQGAPVVLVGGGLIGWLGWQPHVKRLSGTRKVIRLQLLSVQYGLANRLLPPDYSAKLESQALATTLNELELNSAIDLVAESYGAEVSLDYALNHPEQIRSLTLIEPPAFWILRRLEVLDTETQQVAEFLLGLSGEISEDQLEQFIGIVAMCPPGQSVHELPQWPLWMRYRQSLRSCPAVVKHDDDPGRLRSFQPPVLLVKGTDSAKFLHQIIDALGTLLPRNQVIEMPWGHAPHITSRDRFLEQLSLFLNQANS